MSVSPRALFSGINGASGGRLFEALSFKEIAALALGREVDKFHELELGAQSRGRAERWLDAGEGIDKENLSLSGWAVVLPELDESRTAAILEALEPLLKCRRKQAEERYKEFTGMLGYRSGETKADFLARHGMGPGPADPTKVPYYLLLVGSPSEIPFSFQYQLDVQYAVGRVHFETLDDLARYAESVNRRERSQFVLSKSLFVSAPENDDDEATSLSSRELVRPLVEALEGGKGSWQIERSIGPSASKKKILDRVAQAEPPAIWFSASHGMGFPSTDPRRLKHQGALLCQDWPGPITWGDQAIPPEFYMSCDDLGKEAKVAGMISFLFACYGGGTPSGREVARDTGSRVFTNEPAFMAGLPLRLLSHEKGGALAVVAHVDRAWSYSFSWRGADRQIEVFRSTLSSLMKGRRLGSAMEHFSSRYGELATDLVVERSEINDGRRFEPRAVAALWTALVDARNYLIIGDPAVRAAV